AGGGVDHRTVIRVHLVAGDDRVPGQVGVVDEEEPVVGAELRVKHEEEQAAFAGGGRDGGDVEDDVGRATGLERVGASGLAADVESFVIFDRALHDEGDHLSGEAGDCRDQFGCQLWYGQ